MSFDRVELAEGRAVLYRGDCLEVMASWPDDFRVDAVVTDPPYGISYTPLSGQDRTGKRHGASNTWHPSTAWDTALPSKLGADVSDIVCCFGHWRQREEVARIVGKSLRAEIVWAKDCHSGPPNPIAPKDERIWVFSDAGINGRTFETTVWNEAIIPTWRHRHHSNEKPTALMRRLVRWVPANTILDPFMGSGTTGVAALQLGRRFIGIELEQKYFDIACERIDAASRQDDLFGHDSAGNPEQDALL